MSRFDMDRQLNEQRLDEEWRAQQAEGKRRQREFEGIGEPTRIVIVAPNGSKREMTRSIGTRATPLDSASPAFNGDPSVSLYIASPDDEQDLAKELADLDRDAQLMARHETVNYFPPSEEKEDDYCDD